MVIRDFNYNEDVRSLYIEFSTDDDGDDYYRTLWLSLDEIEYYSPSIIQEYELFSIEDDFILDLLERYISENDLPDEKSL